MIELAPRDTGTVARFSGQPIAIAAVAFVVVVLGIGSIALWRAYTGTAPETDRVVATRQLQARTAQASEQLGGLTEDIDGLRQSFATAQATEPDAPPSTRKLSVRKAHGVKPQSMK